MTDGRPRIPRRLTEGVVIVVSILLAFGIEAWWDERGDRAEERNILEALQEEFTANRAALQEAVRIQEDARRRFGYLRGLTVEEVRSLPRDSVGVLVASLASPRTFDAVRGTVDALVGAGDLGLLRSQQLQRALTSFLSVLGDAAEDAEYMAEFAIRGWEASLQHGGPWDTPLPISRDDRPTFLSEATAQDLAALRADDMVMGYGAQTRLLAWVYLGELRRLSRDVDRILELVEQELAR